VDLLIETFLKMAKRAEKKVEAELVGTAQLVRGKTQVIRRVARAVVDDAEGRIQDVILPVAGLRWCPSLDGIQIRSKELRVALARTMERDRHWVILTHPPLKTSRLDPLTTYNLFEIIWHGP